MGQGETIRERLSTLRVELAGRGLDGFVIPRNDEFLGEYVPPSAERLAWLTGFTGSAGTAVVLNAEAALFVDGRYTLQAKAEVPPDAFTLCHLPETPPPAWIKDHLPKGARLGFDPWLHAADSVARLEAACAEAGAELVACAVNPVDFLWVDRPAPPRAPVVPHPVTFAGSGAAEKRARLGGALSQAGADAMVLTAPDSLAWLLNIRGGDVPYAPLPLAFALAEASGRVTLFLDTAKRGPGLEDHLGEAVTLAGASGLGPALDALGAAARTVATDPAQAPVWFARRLEAAGARVLSLADPCQGWKAVKNPAEITGMRAAHVQDGVAMARFLAWLDEAALHGGLGEIAASDRLEAFRAEGEHFRSLSFPTISGAGPNGAIVHYRVSAATERRLEPGSVYLVDSGGQYLNGTTDVTRTLAIGPVTPGSVAETAREAFTRVLRGHIALASSRFPEGTTGGQLDAFARRPLWEAGLDYDHGTGHGVGCYLSVHEGPQRISKAGGTVALAAGMVLSNEPGYYRSGAFGIRIENLELVVPAPSGADGRAMLGFEALTLVPIDRRLILTALLSARERAWVDSYHARVAAALSPLLGEAERAWLQAATRPLEG